MKKGTKKKTSHHKKKHVTKPVEAISEKEVKKEVKRVIKITTGQIIGVVLGIILIVFLFMFVMMRMGTPEGAIARVNGEIITQEEINTILEQAKQQNPGVTKEMIINQTIVKYLVVTEAKAQGLEVPSKEVDDYILNLEATFGQSIEPVLEQLGVTLEDLEQQVYEQLLMTKLLVNEVAVEDSEITEEALRVFFDENQNELKQDEQIEASHILVETEEEALEVKAQLDAGAEFAELAKEKSIDPSAQVNNGNLGLFGKGQMVPEFEQAAFSLSEGEISEPVESQFGYHVILLHKKEEARSLVFEEVKGNIRQVLLEELQQKRLLKYVEGLREEADIEYF